MRLEQSRFLDISRRLTYYIICVRSNFGLDPKTELGSGPTSPNNEFVERERKNKPDFRKKVTVIGGLEEKLRV